MLKDLRFSGVFHDDNLSVNVMLENPADYGLEASALLFGVTARSKNSGVTALCPEDFTFYVMDEANHLYNALGTPTPATEGIPLNEESMYRPDWLIHTDFKHDFLFQDLRIAFYHRSYKSITIIELRH